MRRALERVIQQGKGGLVVLGNSSLVGAASSGGFNLNRSAFTPAKLAELSKMDGGIVLDDSWNTILEANVHFIPHSFSVNSTLDIALAGCSEHHPHRPLSITCRSV